MKLPKITIELSDELFGTLKKEAEKIKLSPENYAANLLKNSIKPQKVAPELPSVALYKEVSSQQLAFDIQQPTCKSTPQRRLDIKPVDYLDNKTNRKVAIEAQMQELSLLIDTAENPEKKNQYLMDYALLASELSALL